MLVKYLIICPLVFIAGYIDAIAGGGGLISLPAYMLTGIPVHNCIATNKMSSCMGTTMATVKYAKSGFISWKYAIFCIPMAFLGSAIGANIALSIDDGPFKIIMLIILPMTAAYVLFRKDIKSSKDGFSDTVTILICMAVSLIIGVYDGFYGPGTGTFLILLFTGLARINLEKANGLTKAINLSTNISALVVYFINGQLLIPLGLTAGLFNIAGNYLGARKFEKGGVRIVKPLIITVITIFLVKIIYEMVSGK